MCYIMTFSINTFQAGLRDDQSPNPGADEAVSPETARPNPGSQPFFSEVSKIPERLAPESLFPCTRKRPPPAVDIHFRFDGDQRLSWSYFFG